MDRIKYPLRAVWRAMKDRCYNSKCSAYNLYGGRGIRVCDEWLNAEKFMQWALDNGWQKGLLIDRINNDGNYEPSNCRFVTAKVSANNRRPKRVPYYGEKSANLGGKREGAGRPKGEATKALGLRVPIKYHKYLTDLVRKELKKLAATKSDKNII